MNAEVPFLDRSLLELLHPAGTVRRMLVLGEGSPAGLRQDAVETEAAGRPDLVFVAPDREEAASANWARETARTAATIADDGIVYLVAGPRARRRLTVHLRRQGLARTGAFLHVPNPFEPRFLVPIERATLGYSTTALVPLQPRNRRLAHIVRRAPTTRLLAAVATPVGVVLRPRGARPLFAWARSSAITGPVQTIVVRGRRPQRFTLLLFSAGGSEPRAVVKLVDEQAEAQRLADRLTGFAGAAEAAGAAVPRVIGLRLGSKPAVVESAVAGTSAYAYLLGRPDRMTAVLEPLAGWVGSWNRATARAGSVTPELLERHVWAPAEALEARVSDFRGLHAVLERVCRQAEGERCSLVATHGDLTMSNVLVGHGRVGIVDWEHAAPDGLPLTDWYYAAADAASAVTGHLDRIAAARACFGPGGDHPGIATRLGRDLARQLDLSPRVEELCFLACWLHHAANEAHEPAGPRPFRTLLEWASRAG